MDQPSSRCAERRAWRRRPSRRTAKAACRKGALGLGPDLAVAILDVSETGIRLVVKAALERGQQVEVKLSSQNVVHPALRLGDVRWCVPMDDDQHAVGIRFEKPLTYAELQQLS
jgi:hypothetical protein